jgi:pimeloyl-ACP methyl ester carboxylesterase
VAERGGPARSRPHATRRGSDLSCSDQAGASLALAYVAIDPGRIAGLGLIEPAWSYLPLTTIEQHYYADLNVVLELQPNEQRDAFVRLLVQPGIELPPVTSTAQRGYQGVQRPEDTALAIVTRAMQGHCVESADLRAFRGPVYVGVGGRSNPCGGHRLLRSKPLSRKRSWMSTRTVITSTFPTMLKLKGCAGH